MHTLKMVFATCFDSELQQIEDALTLARGSGPQGGHKQKGSLLAKICAHYVESFGVKRTG